MEIPPLVTGSWGDALCATLLSRGSLGPADVKIPASRTTGWTGSRRRAELPPRGVPAVVVKLILVASHAYPIVAGTWVYLKTCKASLMVHLNMIFLNRI